MSCLEATTQVTCECFLVLRFKYGNRQIIYDHQEHLWSPNVYWGHLCACHCLSSCLVFCLCTNIYAGYFTFFLSSVMWNNLLSAWTPLGEMISVCHCLSICVYCTPITSCLCAVSILQSYALHGVLVLICTLICIVNKGKIKMYMHFLVCIVISMFSVINISALEQIST